MEGSKTETIKQSDKSASEPSNPSGSMLRKAEDRPAQSSDPLMPDQNGNAIENPVANPRENGYQRFERPNPMRSPDRLSDSDTLQKPPANPAGPMSTIPTQEGAANETASQPPASVETQQPLNRSTLDVLQKTPEKTGDKVSAE